VRWLMGMNDRAAMHMLELRTTKQGHPQYRKLCQEIHSAIKKADPWRAEMMQLQCAMLFMEVKNLLN
jgi:thymidylate synthase ThyX